MPSDRPNAVYRVPVPPISEIPLYTKANKCEESNGPDRPKPRCGLVQMNTVLEISVAEVKRRIFDPVVDEIINLLKTHLVKTGNHRTFVIILVGGFSWSKYLQKRIKSFCSQEGISHVNAPPDGVTAISRGAVSYFLEPHLLLKTIATSPHLSNKMIKASPPPPLHKTGHY